MEGQALCKQNIVCLFLVYNLLLLSAQMLKQFKRLYSRLLFYFVAGG